MSSFIIIIYNHYQYLEFALIFITIKHNRILTLKQLSKILERDLSNAWFGMWLYTDQKLGLSGELKKGYLTVWKCGCGDEWKESVGGIESQMKKY